MNLPNRLTIFRIALIPVIILVYIFPYSQFGIEPKTFLFGAVSLSVINLIVLGIYLVAAFTDFLDGNIARKRNMVKVAHDIREKIENEMTYPGQIKVTLIREVRVNELAK